VLANEANAMNMNDERGDEMCRRNIDIEIIRVIGVALCWQSLIAAHLGQNVALEANSNPAPLFGKHQRRRDRPRILGPLAL